MRPSANTVQVSGYSLNFKEAKKSLISATLKICSVSRGIPKSLGTQDSDITRSHEMETSGFFLEEVGLMVSGPHSFS